MREHDKPLRAAKRVEEITGFYVHLIIYGIINLLLLLINWAITPDIWWVQWVILGWGLGVAGHAIGVFGRMPHRVTRWQLRKIRALRQGMP